MAHKVGRPPVYATAKELAAAIDAYFKTLKRDKENDQPPTLAGLAYELGYESRQSLTDQEKRGEEFSYIIKRAKCFIESWHEAGLSGKSCVGHIFWLKNHAGYIDRIENTGMNGLPIFPSKIEVEIVRPKDEQS